MSPRRMMVIASAAALAGPAFAAGCFSTFPNRCGNGILQDGEECDDGNRLGFDGCSPACRLELFTCGDGMVEAPEECEPPGFGDCGLDCQWLDGGVCGNGIVEPGEQCDPPDGVNCNAFCRWGGPPQPPGSPCQFEADCGAPANPAHTALCLNSEAFPNGMCVLLGCTDFGAGSDCPTGSNCISVPSDGGGTVDVCVQLCTPEGNGTGGCRADENEVAGYACYPTVTGGGGVCWSGCASDAYCNEAGLPPDQWTSLCSPANNRCYVIGSPFALIGDPCFADENCTEGGSCLLGDWTGDGQVDWPGGYCSKIGCAAYAGNPVWDCPAGSSCAALSTPWQSVLPLDLCLLDCAGDGSSGSCTRPDDYECMDFADLTGAETNGVAPAGASGWCFECPLEHVITGADPADCP